MKSTYEWSRTVAICLLAALSTLVPLAQVAPTHTQDHQDLRLAEPDTARKLGQEGRA